ncbi:protein-tyrosine-phosphatase MKP1-like isoform X1 [Triticum dicoccoides]|uniref:MAP kinase phosphatase n=1 Tax=Triticum turgidum subsp. durum TaxID=4567 RepID=B1PXB0_TRITD|nr:protein-tyrosine-phosphatase MKP1-like isoform X1 [Triticum dicoccoides]ACB05479.1 MAP kinase phosphatase [Triticum turgidum subsp. durum]
MANPDDGGGRKFWRSASWSAPRAAEAGPEAAPLPPRMGPPPLTPRSKGRACLPPLQPLAITRRSLDEWPKAGSDDVGEWPNPTTPGASKAGGGGGGPGSAKPGEGLRLDLSTLRSQGRKDQIAFFDKECSKVAEHVYLGGDAVAKNRDILRKNGITHVLNCVGFVCPEYFKSDLVYRTLWLQDSPTEDITSILYDVFDYFEDVREQAGRVFVHCCQGVSRSTSLVIAYLMWREGQSFDDAFQFVKAARGIANPNMGFACQLLQCQKRVHAIPLSPNSVLRMYRLAPHSPYAPLHLVPKMLNEPSPAALDSRGAFIVHVLSSIYVWVGIKCDTVMEKDARAAAFQVVRYEKVQGQIKVVREGLEQPEFWDAFSSAPINSDSKMKLGKEQIDSPSRTGVGSRRVESYDSDFELVQKAIAGGVVPAFSSSGTEDETHLPARESSWSLLRRKFISRSLSRVYSDSALIRDLDPRVQHLTAEASISPPFLSPSSLSSDSTISSKYSSDSPSLSPSTSSPPSLGLSPASSNLPHALVPSSRSPLRQSSNAEHSKPVLGSIRSPSKVSSIAERRGGFSCLKLPSLPKELVLPPRAPSIHKAEEATDKSNTNGVKQLTGVSCPEKCTGTSSTATDSNSEATVHGETILIEHTNSEACNYVQLLVYRWPCMEKLTAFARKDLDPKTVFIFVAPNASRSAEAVKMVCVWVGGEYECSKGVESIDWQQVAGDFLNQKGFSNTLPVKVFKEHETENLLEVLDAR